MRTVALIFNRPGVAGAVLQTALSFIDSVKEVMVCENIAATPQRLEMVLSVMK